MDAKTKDFRDCSNSPPSSSEPPPRKRTKSCTEDEEYFTTQFPSLIPLRDVPEIPSHLVCPICFDLFKEVQVIPCGHSYCHPCIRKVVQQHAECPVCKKPIPLESPFTPNYNLNDAVVKFRTSGIKKSRQGNPVKIQQLYSVTSQLNDTDMEEFADWIALRAKNRSRALKNMLKDEYIEFLETAFACAQQEQERVKTRLQCISEDLSRLKEERDEERLPQEKDGKRLSLPPELQSRKSRRSRNRDSCFEDLTQAYFSMRCPEGASEPSSSNWEEDFCSTMNDCVRFSSFREQAMLRYGDGPVGTSSIVSSIEFDKDGDLFAVAGVTRKIKIFDYNTVVAQHARFSILHYPLCELSCPAKLSSVAFNPYFKHQMSSSDYDGTLSVWDINHNKCTHTYQEHEKRIWSLAYNPSDPHVLATGGDDCSLKLWTLASSRSVQSYQTGANVCCVRFQPSNVFQLAYGSADHTITLVDIRKFTQPLQVMKGHRKAVSYVHYLPDEELLVSASTDSELKLWSLTSNTCVRTYNGHVNEKNFVGLTVNNGFIACGSENNAVYVYHKFISRPILKYRFDVSSSILPTETKQESHNDFVSSVCLRKGSNALLAANSQGFIKVLEMVE